MALTTPILYSQVAFDATNSQTFNFGVIGGDQVAQNRLVIINQSTGVTVYNQVQTTYSFVHTVPANTLTNGVYYSAYLITYDANSNASPQSNSIQFFCYSTPSFQFTNLPIGNIITNSSFAFEVTYEQAEGELLDTYSFTLYNASQSQISTSGIKYIGSSVAPPTSINYTFSGFSDQTSYYIRANGQTEQGTLVDTGLIAINVAYVKPNIFSIIELSNNCQGGYINIKSNLIEIRSSSNPSPPVYVDNNTAVDARASGRYDFPSSFMLVCAMNPCKCGFYGHPTKKCTCSDASRENYLSKVSGPMLDRIDIQIEVGSLSYEQLSDKQVSEKSADIRRRVVAAREIMEKRYAGTGIHANAYLTPAMIREYCVLENDAEIVMKGAFERLGLSARGYDRILKLSRTIADMDGCKLIGKQHVARAVQLRSLDRKYWSN